MQGAEKLPNCDLNSTFIASGHLILGNMECRLCPNGTWVYVLSTGFLYSIKIVKMLYWLSILFRLLLAEF